MSAGDVAEEWRLQAIRDLKAAKPNYARLRFMYRTGLP